MMQTGDQVRARNTEHTKWDGPLRFVGLTSSEEYLCELNGKFASYKFCEKIAKKKVRPMDFDDVWQLVEWKAVFKHIGSGVISRNPVISMLQDEQILIDGRIMEEMVWAIPQNAKDGKWERCEVDGDD